MLNKLVFWQKKKISCHIFVMTYLTQHIWSSRLGDSKSDNFDYCFSNTN